MSFTLSKLGAEITVPDLTISNAATRKYPLVDSRYESGSIEQEITFSKLPQRFVFDVPLSVKDAVFIRQPPLTEEFNKKDCEVWTETHVKTKLGREVHRPIDIVESLAVYHSFKRDNDAKTGKIMHIPRPKLTDKLGAVGWGKSAYVNGALQITLPGQFMKDAAYPVVVDPTFGYTSAGASSDDLYAGYCYGTDAEMAEAGTVSKITAYMEAGSSQSAYAALYERESSPYAQYGKTAQTSGIQATAWYDFTFGTPLAGQTAETKMLALGDFSGNVKLYYDSGGTGESHLFYVSGSLPASWTDGGDTGWGNRYSIYATYTIGGGSVSQGSDGGAVSAMMAQSRMFLRCNPYSLHV
jgi:hypothetical protein